MARKPTLRADSHPLKRLFLTLSIPIRDKLRRLEHPLLHLFEVLQLGELARNHSHDDILVLGQLLERLEATSSCSVVFEVVGVDIELFKELGGNAVVAAFAKVPRVYEVAPADVNADVHVCRPLGDAGVVEVDVFFEKLVGGFSVDGVLLPAFEHGLRAEVYTGGKGQRW